MAFVEPIEDFPAAPVDQPTTVVSDEQATEQVFYAVGIAQPNDMVNQFEVSRYNLKTYGQDALVDSVQQRWQQEQDKDNKAIVADVIADTTIDPETKYRVLQGYSMSGFISKDIRDKYIQQIAAKDYTTSEEDKTAQEIVIDTLVERQRAREEAEKELWTWAANTETSTVKNLAGFVAEIFPLEAMRLYKLQREFGDKTPLQAVWGAFVGRGDTKEELRRIYTKLPMEKRPEFVRKFIDVIKNAPGFDIGKYHQVVETLESEAPQSAFWKNADNVFGILDAVGIGWTVRHPVKTVKWFKPQLGIKPRGPAGVTAHANPAGAATVGAGAIADETGRLARAMNQEPGAFIQEWTLPKIDQTDLELVPNLPSELEAMDNQIRRVYEETEVNPTLINQTERKATADRVQNVLQEVGLPIYNQGSSTLRNITDAKVFSVDQTLRKMEGVATFGRTKNYGYTTSEGAQKALTKLQDKLKLLPEDEQGTAKIVYWDENKGFQEVSGKIPEDAPKQYFIQWNWKKDFDTTDLLMFGDDGISTKLFGFDVSGLARSTGNWLFPQYDRVKPWVYKGAVQSEFMERLLDRSLLKPLLDNIIKSPHGKEIGQLLDEGNRIVTPTGGKVFSYADVVDKFPKKSIKEIQEIYRGYAIGRRVADYHWAFSNRLDRARKAEGGYEAIYDDLGELTNYGRRVTTAPDVATFVNLSNHSVVRKADVLDTDTIVQLDRKISVGTEKFEYGILGGSSRLGGLPTNTLNYLTGYMPRMYKDQFFWVDVVPKNLKVNGRSITDTRKIDEFKETIRATNSKQEAMDIADKYMKDNPEWQATVRPDRLDRPDRALEEYQVYSSAHTRARQRGDHILNYEGQLADVEDPVVGLVKSVRGVAHRTAFQNWRQLFEEQYLKEYKDFLQEGKFPRSLSEISGMEHMDVNAAKKYQDAIEYYKYYADINDISETISDRLWRNTLHGVADILDDKAKWSPDFVREAARKGNMVVRGLQKTGTTLFIFTNPIRQAVIQTQQMWDLGMMTPSAFKEITITNMSIMFRMAGERMGKTVGGLFEDATVLMAKFAGYSKQEFDDIYDAYKMSGVAYSVDSNMVLHGMFNEADKPLNMARKDKVQDMMQTITGAKAIRGAVRVGKLGFDAGEFTNMTGSWVWARKRWLNQNPNKDWKTTEARAEIAVMARNISGSMTKSGALAYQKGVLAIPFQFASIGHKLFLQPMSSKYLTSAEKGRLLAARTIWYGAYGTGLVGIAEMLREKYYDEEYADIWDGLMGGISDWAWNNFLDNSIGPDGNELSISPGITPVPKFGLPYFDFLHSMYKDGAEGFYSKVPLKNIIGRVDQMLYDVSYIFGKEEVDTPTKAQLVTDSVLQLSSGYSNTTKAMMIMETRKLVDKFGNDYGFEAGWKTAIGRLLGFQTKEEEALFAIEQQAFNVEKDLRNDMKMLHNSMERIERAGGNFMDVRKALEAELQIVRMYPEHEREMALQFFEAEDRKSFKDKNYSVLMKLSEMYRGQANAELNSAVARLSNTNNPKAQELLKILRDEQVTQ